MIGKTILHYKILEKLGEGGMGVVYKAEDTKLDRTVAIKFLPKHIAGNSEERERFVIEAKAAAALNHSNIATIHAIEESDDPATASKELFIVMEYIEGQELKDLINIPLNPPSRGEEVESPFEGGARRAGDVLPINDIINYATQIASGLQAAHEKGIIHRDIKSSNIMITPKGQVKIMDFGLAKMNGSLHMTKAGSTLGTPFYMSPEQTRGETVDQRSDIWSFGVVLYEMLTGQLPFKGDYEQAIIYSILNEAPEAMTGVAPELEQVVLKALAKNPDERYPSADELAADLQAIGSGQSVKVKSAAKPAKLIYGIAAAVVVLIAVAFYLFRPASQPLPEKESVKTIAVLPFLDMSPNKDQEYFSDGISEELLNVLARNPKLRVTSRTSAFSFKEKEVDIKTIAAKLNVQHILEGSVRKAGNTLRITAQLIDVETDAHLWSQTYDGTLDNIFALQDSISGSVAEALKIALLGKESATQQRETDPEAYNYYLLGKHFFDLRGKENYEKAEGYYEKALSIDPNYAPAWVGLSLTHSNQAGIGYLPVDEGYQKSRKEAQKALELNPNLADAHARMGWIKRSYDWDWKGADESFQLGLDLDPGNARVINGAAMLASTLGRFDESIALLRRAIELDPVWTSLYFNLGSDTWYAGLLDESITAYRKSLELNPQYPAAHVFIGLVYLAKGKPDSALVEMDREAHPIWKMFGFALVYHALVKKKEADEKLAEFIEKYKNDAAFQIAEIYAYRGETDKAFEWLERAYDQRDGGLSFMKGDPLLRNIVKDPRYAAFLKKMKLPL